MYCGSFINKEQWCDTFPNFDPDPLLMAPKFKLYYNIDHSRPYNLEEGEKYQYGTFDAATVYYCDPQTGIVNQTYLYQKGFTARLASTYSYEELTINPLFSPDSFISQLIIMRCWRLGQAKRRKDGLTTKVGIFEPDWTPESSRPRWIKTVLEESSYDPINRDTWREASRACLVSGLIFHPFLYYKTSDTGELLLAYQPTAWEAGKNPHMLPPENLGAARTINFGKYPKLK